MDIQIYKVDETVTDKFIKSKKVDRWILDTWVDNGPAPVWTDIPKFEIKALAVKSLFQHCIPVFEGIPHLEPPAASKYEGMYLQSDEDIRGINLSFGTFWIPADVKFKLIALFTQYKKFGGAQQVFPYRKTNVFNMGLVPVDELLSIGNWSTMHPMGHFMGAVLTPLPLGAPGNVLVPGGDIDAIRDEINFVSNWYLQNQSLLYPPVTAERRVHKPLKLVRPTLSKGIVGRIEKITRQYFTGNLISRFVNTGALDIYHADRIGIKTDRQMRELEQVWDNSRLLRRQVFEKQRFTLQMMMKDQLAEKYFGKKYDDLSGKDSKFVDDKYKRQAAIPTGRIIDPAQVLVNDLRHALGEVTFSRDTLEKIWTQIKETFPLKKGATEMIAPRHNPKLGILCPHLIDYAEQIMRLTPSSFGFDTQTVIERIVHTWSEPNNINYQYWCKSCGELLYVDQLDDFNIFGPQKLVSNIGDWDPLHTKVFNEVTQALRLVKFKKLVGRNIKSLVTAITGMLEPEMQKIQTQLQNMKTKSLEDVNLTMILYICIYAYAFLSKMIIDHPDKMSWNVKIKTGGASGKLATTTLAIAYALITNAKGTLIGKIKDFSSEMIKPILMAAFSFANKAPKMAATSGEDEDVDLDERILSYSIANDQIYRFAKSVWGMFNDKAPKPTDLFGVKTFGDVCKLKTPYEKMYRPPAGSVRNYDMILELVNEIAPKRYNVVPLDPILQAWWKKWSFLADADQERDDRLAFRRAAPKIKMYRDVMPNGFKDIFISDIRCPDGQKHDYSLTNMTYVFKSGQKTQKLKLRQFGERAAGSRLVAEECALCGQPYGAKIDDVKRTKDIESHVQRVNTFKYFENRCPVAPMHEFPVDKHGFIGDLPCKKCGFYKSMMNEMPVAWYNKWKSYVPKHTIKNYDLTPLKEKTAKKEPARFDKWSVTLASVLQISKLSDVPYNAWINLGLTEHRSFGMIRQSKINPHSQAYNKQARNIKLLDYIEYVRRTYYLIKNHARITVPPNIKALLENEPPGGNLIRDMPDILENLYPKLEYYKSTQTEDEVANFLLHTLCNTLLQIHALSNKLKKFATRIFEFICGNILRSEQLFSELDVHLRYIATSTYGEEEAAPPPGLEADDDIGRLGEDKPDIFSLEDVDIETTNTGIDDEEFMD